jgi:hypothetical protein
MGRGNSDARCLRRPKVKRPEPTRGGCCGRGVVSNETWPPELPSEREDSEARVTGSASVVVLSTDSRGSASDACRGSLRDARSFSSTRLAWLFLNASGPPRFRSIDLRKMPGWSPVVGSNERRRRPNCCSRPRFFGVVCAGSGSIMVGAVVMMAGAAGSYVSTRTSTRHGQPTLWVHRHGGHGRGVVAGGVLLGLERQLRVRGVAEAHQAEAARVGRRLLHRRRGGFVVSRAQRGARNVARVWPPAIFRGGAAVGAQVLAGLVEARVLVAALEEIGRVEGAAALEVALAAARTEGPQRHCGVASSSSTREGSRSAGHGTADERCRRRGRPRDGARRRSGSG